MAYAEAQHAIARAALMSPTYDEIMDRIGKGKDIDKKKLELEELKKSLESCPPGPQRSTMEEEIDSYKIWIDLILPTDFLAALIAYCLGVNKSDIKKVSEKMLLNLAIMAVKGNDNPHNHIDGDLTPFNLYDIDFRSWLIYADYLEEQKNGTAKPEI
jgi:hypothetical protein